MFSGIVEATGRVVALVPAAGGSRVLEVETPWAGERPAVGESVAVDGVCLTVERRRGVVLAFSLSPETLARSTLGDAAAVGRRVNLERSLALGQPLGGHLVLGHVDAVAEVAFVRPAGEGKEIGFRIPDTVAPLVALKGSVAINGVSLTVAGLFDGGFWAALVPYTLDHTNLGDLRAGARVNFEADVLARYVARQLEALAAGRALTPGAGVTLALLADHGFLQDREQGGE
ncbi:riboflavin synthase [Carboxydochorda subterranea]|uniref:Riboflavin synthase n=1 Tax=Carboxydichorda subterranea TaxID=3109565 RepID=A0ABZ1C058_9FIRM|nr:riboflavin synthase [Limnochorda sp. L945t]WRP17698.1 riboflavin synthase [Limnochorda sp. L945t]